MAISASEPSKTPVPWPHPEDCHSAPGLAGYTELCLVRRSLFRLSRTALVQQQSLSVLPTPLVLAKRHVIIHGTAQILSHRVPQPPSVLAVLIFQDLVVMCSCCEPWAHPHLS